MTNEQCTNVAEKAWNLANEPGTNFSASVALKDCAFTIKEMQSRIADIEKDAARYRWFAENGENRDHDDLVRHLDSYVVTKAYLDDRIDTAMQKD